jgi:hypothetical protein
MLAAIDTFGDTSGLLQLSIQLSRCSRPKMSKLLGD